MSNAKTEEMSTINFQDLVILKQFLEKGFRENFFNKQEIGGARMEHAKLTIIISHILEKNKDKVSELKEQ